ncbi:hypothetical protein BD560DRAFT_443873 [Blakeslea trispora]|nr:hypothetical protein BD560DRAFT_443873 [Blakeslea trispora]
MKSGSDNLANYNRAFFNTMKMAQVYTCHIIQNKMTLVRHRIKPTSQSQVVECRSSSIFLSFSEIIQYTKVFELSLSCCILWLNRMEFVH